MKDFDLSGVSLVERLWKNPMMVDEISVSARWMELQRDEAPIRPEASGERWHESEDAMIALLDNQSEMLDILADIAIADADSDGERSEQSEVFVADDDLGFDPKALHMNALPRRESRRDIEMVARYLKLENRSCRRTNGRKPKRHGK